MRAFVVGVLALMVTAQPALAWNEQGHFVVARLAWSQLSPTHREKVTRILQAHPHYEEYLAAGRPEGIGPGEWAFMRAAYWSDWVRSNHSEQFNQPTWHYVTAAFIPRSSHLKPENLPSASPNVVTQIPFCIEKLRGGSDGEKAVHLCWLLHLVGDIHQPLHCASMLSEAFPNGDRGGNLSLVRFNGGMPVKLHLSWDNLLGELTSLPDVEQTVRQLQQQQQGECDSFREELQQHRSPAQWAEEGFRSAAENAYLNGDLVPANGELSPSEDLVPNLGDAYLENARKVARVAAIKAAYRLAESIRQGLE